MFEAVGTVYYWNLPYEVPSLALFIPQTHTDISTKPQEHVYVLYSVIFKAVRFLRTKIKGRVDIGRRKSLNTDRF